MYDIIDYAEIDFILMHYIYCEVNGDNFGHGGITSDTSQGMMYNAIHRSLASVRSYPYHPSHIPAPMSAQSFYDQCDEKLVNAVYLATFEFLHRPAIQ